MTARTCRVDLYRGADGKWRWRFRAANGAVLADSGQGYWRQSDALTGLRLVTGSWVDRTPDSCARVAAATGHQTDLVLTPVKAPQVPVRVVEP